MLASIREPDGAFPGQAERIISLKFSDKSPSNLYLLELKQFSIIKFADKMTKVADCYG
jgi:hypothetical protein